MKEKTFFRFAAFTALALLALNFFNRKIKNTMNGNNSFSAKDFQDSLPELRKIFTLETLRKIEQIYRLETRNFQSRQYQLTGTAGMEAPPNSNAPNFGWSAARLRLVGNPLLSIVAMNENKGLSGTGGGQKRFIAFPSVFQAAAFLGYTIEQRGGNAAAWYTTNPERQQAYNNALEKINPSFVNQLA